jgi:hypothetical protein
MTIAGFRDKTGAVKHAREVQMTTAFTDGFALSNPVISGQLGFRIGLARRRTAAYPLDSMDFIMMDLERPDGCARHAHWCTGDLTGRLLEFLAAAEGVDGNRDERLPALFERILLQRRANGYFGRFVNPEDRKKDPGQNPCDLGARLFSGLVRYHQVSGDWRALEWAVAISDELLRRKDEFVRNANSSSPPWIGEPGANLYRITGDRRHLELCTLTADVMRNADKRFHTHGFLCGLRGLQLAALHTGDKAWNELPEQYRRLITERRYDMPNGDVPEAMRPGNFRNEGCAAADWMLLNLYSAAISGESALYDVVENILWNALFFNQFVTGGFGHRRLLPHGYGEWVSEAWWCCTEHCGMAMSDLARHAVTRRGKTVSINLLVPGKFTLPVPGQPDINVRITTRYPEAADSVIDLDPLPPDSDVAVHIPACVRGGEVLRRRRDDGMQITVTGRIGHNLAEAGDRVMLKYGPLVLAPMAYHWRAAPGENDQAIPEGYCPPFLPAGLPELRAGPVDKDGFVTLGYEPQPLWSYFDEGPNARCGVGHVSANVPVRFPGGTEKTLRFWPLCYLTSDMSLYETPILFPIQKE